MERDKSSEHMFPGSAGAQQRSGGLHRSGPKEAVTAVRVGITTPVDHLSERWKRSLDYRSHRMCWEKRTQLVSLISALNETILDPA